MSQADKNLLTRLVKYALDYGYQASSSGSAIAFTGPDRLCKVLVISIGDFIEKKIKQQVDDELLKLLGKLFTYSQDTLIGSYEWYLIDDKNSPDGKRLIYLSGYEACMKHSDENVISIDQIINYRTGHLKAFLKGEVRRDAVFPVQSDNHPFLKKYVQPVLDLHRRLYKGERLESLAGEIKRVIEEIERPNRERLAYVFKLSFSNLLTDLGY